MVVQALGDSFSTPPSSSNLWSKDTFFQLLIMELTHQDPMEPMNNRDFITQLAQFSSLEQLSEINGRFSSLFQAQVLYQAGQMLGCRVEGVDPSTQKIVRGKVEEVYWKDGVCYLKIEGEYLPLSSITKVLSK